MKSEESCKKCAPTPHPHLDHSYQSYIDEDDAGSEIVVHVYSCKICPCDVRMEGGDLDAFKKAVMDETGLAI